MSLFPASGGGKGGTKKLVATAAANQTYGAQLSYLYTYYNTLSELEKAESYLIMGTNRAVYIINGITSAVYVRVSTAQTGVVGNTANLSAGKYYSFTGTTNTEKTTDTNSDTIELYA